MDLPTNDAPMAERAAKTDSICSREICQKINFNERSVYYRKFSAEALLASLKLLDCSHATHNFVNQVPQMTLEERPFAVEAQQIDSDVRKIKLQSLAIVRNIEQLVIKIPARNLKLEFTHFKHHDVFGGETTLVTQTKCDGSGTASFTLYVIQRHTVQHLPEHERRPLVAESEVVLAFPILSCGLPLVREEDTYSGFSKDEGGLRYLVQADFILDEKHEFIDSAANWNACVRKGILATFQKGLYRFINAEWSLFYKSAPYAWLNYLSCEDMPCAKFWMGLKRDIVGSLARERILRSRDDAANLQYPSALKYIPHDFRIKSIPLVDELENRKSHLSFLYDNKLSKSLSTQLALLGVQEMTCGDFLEEFEAGVASKGAQFFENRSDQWHTKVADILRKCDKAKLFKIPMVPLRDGRWVKPSEGKIFLLSETDDVTIPHCMNVSLVDIDACKAEVRHEFFRWLGIKILDRADICEMILELHKQDSRTRTLDEHVSDALYIYNTPRSNFDGRVDDLGFYAGAEGILDWQVCRADEIYIDLPGDPWAIGFYACYRDSGLRILHPAYVQDFSNEEEKTEFVKWLLSRTGISRLPRLIKNSCLTTEFKFFTTNGILRLIKLLRENPHHYGPQLDNLAFDSDGIQCPLRERLSLAILQYTNLATPGAKLPVAPGHPVDSRSRTDFTTSCDPIAKSKEKIHTSDKDHNTDEFYDSGVESSPKRGEENKTRETTTWERYPVKPFDFGSLRTALPETSVIKAHKRDSSRTLKPPTLHKHSRSASDLHEIDVMWDKLPFVSFEKYSNTRSILAPT